MSQIGIDLAAVLLAGLITFVLGFWLATNIVTSDIKNDCKTMRMFRLGATVYDCTEQPKEK